VPPRRVVVSLNAGHFARPDLFWERSVRYGFLDRAELAEVLDTARKLGDRTVLAPHRDDGLPPSLRSLLYSVRFPSLYFNALQKGGVFLRLWGNQARLAESLAARGQYFFGTEPGSSAVAAEGTLERFAPLPVQDHYFARMLELLADRGIPADFIAMPLNRSTHARVLADVERDFGAYLAVYAARFDNFSVVGAVMPYWPDRYFGDEFAHLNPPGAALFSAGLGACLRARLAGQAGDCRIGSPAELAAQTP
jgi:hypothetical protein